PFAPRQRMEYNAATPVGEGDTVMYAGSGRGVRAVKFEKKGDKLTPRELWKNTENSVQFNTPILKDGLVYGISARDTLFCINTKDGKTAWTAPIRGNRGYGSLVDVGPALLALTPVGELNVFEPSDKKFTQLAKYKVADRDTYACPVAS